jgi:hypothetical protein
MAIFPQLIELFQIKDPRTSSVQDCMVILAYLHSKSRAPNGRQNLRRPTTQALFGGGHLPRQRRRPGA